MRIVSLACSNTEIVCALGRADFLVGVDDHSDYPEGVVASLPRVGPDLEIDVDRVEALEPDLVLASLTVPGHEKVVEEVDARGLPYIAPEPTSLPDVYENIRTIAELLGVPERGRELAQEMRAVLGDGSRDAGEPREGPSILVQWWPKPVIAPGRRSWTTDVIERAGGRNPLGREPVKSRPMEDTEVHRLAPDAIILSWCGVDPAKYRPDVIYRNEEWQDLPALQEQRVFCVPEAYLGRPGPRLLDGYREIRRVIEAVEAGEPGEPRDPPGKRCDRAGSRARSDTGKGTRGG